MNANLHKPFIIPIFLPHAGCPHRCVFCNQEAITGSPDNRVDGDQIRSQIRQYLGYRKAGRRPVQISFYGGSFLGLEGDQVELLLNLATEFIGRGQVDGIRFSTRPDTISPERLDVIEEYPIKTIEIGVQSMDDEVLALSKRGHSAGDTIRAVHLLREREYEIGLQMMVGLPGDTEIRSLITAEKIAALQPDFVRIYPTLVVENSRLEKLYQKGIYEPLSLPQAVTRVKGLYRLFKDCNIPVIRMGLQASDDLADGSTVLAGPYHPAFGHLVYSEVFFDAARDAIDSLETLSDTIAVTVNPRSVSEMRGLNNENIEKLRRRYQFKKIEVKADASLGPEELRVR